MSAIKRNNSRLNKWNIMSEVTSTETVEEISADDTDQEEPEETIIEEPEPEIAEETQPQTTPADPDEVVE